MSGEVFLVDDNSSNLSLLAGILRDAGLRVRAANTGKRALAMIRAQRPELVMLDITMPEMDGFEVCRELKADETTRDIPVIFISALDEPLDKVKAFRAGGVDYVTKPFQAEEVVVRVETQLKIWRLQHETDSKNAALESANRQIRAAQEQIARLARPSSGRLEDTTAWASSMASEVARAIAAREIGVWLLEGDVLTPVAPGSAAPPVVLRARASSAEVSFSAPEGLMVVPVVGMTGETCGVLVIDGSAGPLDETQSRLVSGLAHHLGTAFELRSLRRQLTEAEAARATTRRALHERGIETLLLCPKCGRCTADSGSGTGEGATKCADDGAALDGSRVLPFRLGSRYRFERLIGEGGMGTVFSAHDESLERDVSVKIIKPQFLGDPAMRFRLQREAKVVARIQHPGVTAIFDTGELEGGAAFLVMELLRGRDLSGLLSEFGAGTPLQVARLLRQTGAALGAAHRAGVIHRDVKPANVFLVDTPEGFQAKLLDFGLALSARFDARLTQTGIAVGTPAYMSPEQLQCADLDGRSDVYSLASVVWEALVGRRLVEGTNMGEVMFAVLSVPPPPPSLFLPWVDPEIDRLFEAALSKSRDARPADVERWSASLAILLEAGDSIPGIGWPREGLSRQRLGAPERTEVHTEAPTFGKDPKPETPT
jgi:CheY-like chemotaxis protein